MVSPEVKRRNFVRNFSWMPAMFIIGLLEAHVWFLGNPNSSYFIGFAVLWSATAALRAYAHAALYKRSMWVAHLYLAAANFALVIAPLIMDRGLFANACILAVLLLIQFIYVWRFDQIARQLFSESNRMPTSASISVGWSFWVWIGPLTLFLLDKLF